MLKSDREVTDRSQIDQIIRGSQVCHLGFAVQGEPYVLPMSFGYDGEALYFHTAREGTKIDLISANPRICFELERDVTLVTSPDDPCGWTFHYESVVGYGTISELTSPERKAHALNQIMRQYSGHDWALTPAHLEPARIWRLSIESVTGKRSR